MALLVLWATVIVTSIPVLCASSWSCQNTTAEILGCTCFNTSSLHVSCNWKNLTSLPAAFELPIFAEHLDLSKNSLQVIEGFQFSSLRFLSDLNLSWNKLTKLQENAFSNLTRLYLLNLSHNFLKVLPSNIFKGISKLQKLDLSFNLMYEFEVTLFRDLPNLDVLSFEYNYQLGNFLTSVKRPFIEAFNNGLRQLYIGYTNLTRVTKYFFDNAEDLRILSLTGNPLMHIPSLPSMLEVLDLSGCHFQNVSARSFVHYIFLEKLILNNMPNLTEIQKNAFEGLISLESLSIDNCVLLHTFDKDAFVNTFSNKCPLRHLSLARSGLQYLSEDIFASLKKLETLDLQGNPWLCDCHLAWLRDINMSSSYTKNLRCFYPKHLHNKLLMHVDRAEFSCSKRVDFSDSYKGTVAATVFLFIFGFVGLGTVGYHRYKHSFSRRSRRIMPVAQTQGYELLDFNPNAAEYEFDEVENIWATSSSNKPSKL